MTTTQLSQQQSKTLVVTPIPCPGEDYDAAHTTVASLASLRAMAESYDAIMDSIMNTTAKRMAKLEEIEKRAEQCRSLVKIMKKVGDYGGAVTVSAPSSYERAIAGNKSKHSLARNDSIVTAAEAEEEEEKTTTTPDIFSTLTSTTISSAIDQARIASNAAVLNALKQDSMQDDGMAKPSDAWLDRASGFDEHRACRNAERANSVPLLGRVYYRYRGDYYTMDDEEAAANANAATKKEKSNTKKREMMMKKEQQGPSIRRMDNTDIHKTTFSGATSRQQAASGSTPYLCEVLHDAYGMGTIPPAGGEFYPEPADVGELLVFNSSRKTYGGSLLSVGVGKEAAAKKAAERRAKKKEEVDLIDLSDSHDQQPVVDLLGGESPAKETTEGGDDEDKILSSDFAHPRSKMFQVPSYRPEAVPSNAGKLELPTDLPLTDVVKVAAEGGVDEDKGDKVAAVDHLDTAVAAKEGGKDDAQIGAGRRGKKQLANAGEFV